MRNFKYFLGAMAFTVGFTAAQHAAALDIHATLTSFDPAGVTITGTQNTTGGGIGTFVIVGGDPLTPNLAFLESAPTFEAICLEPQEFVTVGQTYIFDVVDLSDAPTSRPGGMGDLRQGWYDNAMSALGISRVEDLAGIPMGTTLGQMVAWEAAGEFTGAFDRDGGTTQVFGGIAPDVTIDAIEGLINGPTLGNIDSYALLNVGVLGAPTTRSLFRGQDFAVHNVVPTPAPLALMGLGLMGIAWFARKKGLA